VEPKNTSWLVRVTAYTLFFVFALVAFEGLSRLFFAYKEDLGPFLNSGYSAILEKTLDPYEIVSPDGYAHWRLRPGFRANAQSVVDAKTKSGKRLGAAAFATDVGTATSPATGIYVNANGFRGPEIKPAKDRMRILMIGDSVTFGLANTTYPDQVRDVLRERGIDAVVINAGVEGYSVRNVEIEMQRYLALNPDIVTILIGWNDLFSEYHFPKAWYMKSAAIRFLYRLKSVIRIWISTPDDIVRKMYAQRGDVSFDDPEIGRLHQSQVEFIDRLLNVAERFQRSGTQVFLMTLPGLFETDEMPSDKALSMGHLPHNISNPIVFASLTDRANTFLMEGAARKGVKILDLASWSKKTLVPRDTYYLDSVHLTANGLRLLGDYIALELCRKLPVKDGRGAGCQ